MSQTFADSPSRTSDGSSVIESPPRPKIKVLTGVLFPILLATRTKSRIFTMPSPLTSGFGTCVESILSPRCEATSTKSRIFTTPSPLASPKTLVSCAVLPVKSMSDKPSIIAEKISFFILFFKPDLAEVPPFQRMEFEILDLFVNH